MQADKCNLDLRAVVIVEYHSGVIHNVAFCGCEGNL